MEDRIMRVARWLSLALLLPLAALGCAPKVGPEPVWVGQLLSLDGPNRAIGQHARQGVEQAVAEVRAAGQTVGGRPLAVLHVDDRGDAATVRAETVRLRKPAPRRPRGGSGGRRDRVGCGPFVGRAAGRTRELAGEVCLLRTAI